MLGHREAIDDHLEDSVLRCLEMAAVSGGQLDAGQQPVIEGRGQQTLALLLDLGQQAAGVPRQNALHPSLGGATAAAISGDPHQHAVAIPGVVELVVADVDVFATVFPQGKAEALARAAQPRRDQLFVVAFEQTRLALFDQAQPVERIKADAQHLLVGLERES